MAPTVFITGNQSKLDELAPLLHGLDLRTKKLALCRPEGVSLLELAHARVLDAWEQVGEPCLTECTALALRGRSTMSGASFKRLVTGRSDAYIANELGGRHGTTAVAVAYCADGLAANVQVYGGEIRGEFVRQPSGSGGLGWDRWWRPEGFSRTLADLIQFKSVINMRQRPYLELADHLRGEASDQGTYEAHVTIAASDHAEADRFCQVCDSLGVKSVLIELPHGQTTSQPMTASYHRGSLGQARSEVNDIAAALVANGHEVTRIKLEAVGNNPHIPQTDARAAQTPDNYFEYHVKVLLRGEAERTAVQTVATNHGARLSANATKIREDGVVERFITARVYGVGRPKAERVFAELVSELSGTGVEFGQRIREYTIYDSNVGVDRGWLDPPS